MEVLQGFESRAAIVGRLRFEPVRGAVDAEISDLKFQISKRNGIAPHFRQSKFKAFDSD